MGVLQPCSLRHRRASSRCPGPLALLRLGSSQRHSSQEPGPSQETSGPFCRSPEGQVSPARNAAREPLSYGKLGGKEEVWLRIPRRAGHTPPRKPSPGSPGSWRAEGQRPCPAGRRTHEAFQNKNHKQTAQVQNRKEFLAGPRKPDVLIRPEVTHLAAQPKARLGS